jgi:hypothetical protein
MKKNDWARQSIAMWYSAINIAAITKRSVDNRPQQFDGKPFDFK